MLVTVRVYRLNKKNPLPEYMSEDASGIDLRASLKSPVKIEPGRYSLIPTGVILAIPKGYEGQVRPRSGLACTYGLTVLNTPGTIDSDYRGEIKVLLINHGDKSFTVTDGMRIAQLVFHRVTRISLREVKTAGEIDTTERHSGGFGHTGY